MVQPQPRHRKVAYAQEGIVKQWPDGRRAHVVAIVTENEPGYSETTYTGTLDYCKTVADSINEDLGATPDDVAEIVTSSMREQNTR